MSTITHETASTTDQPLSILLFEYPGADIIFCSQDSYHLRVPRVYIINSSPILDEHIKKTLDTPGDLNPEPSLPLVRLPESGEMLRCLFTFIFPVAPLLPSTPEEIMKLLSVAQKYQMETTLTHIRGSIARQNSLPTSLEPLLHTYAFAQKYGLRPEALQTAQAIFLKQSMTIEDFGDKLEIMSGASLYELWEYHKKVRIILASDLTVFRESCADGTITGLRCAELSSSQIPSWLNQYIESIGKSPNLFDYGGLNMAMACHVKDKANEPGCECSSISSQTISVFWEALASVVYGGFKKAEPALCLVQERNDLEDQIISAASPLEPFDVSDTNLIIRSSDKVIYRVHKTVLAMASPFFKDLLSLPQPSDGEVVDGLPVVQIPESSELLNALISILYPVPTVIPSSHEKVLYLLAACQKYEMASVQSFIHAEVSRGTFPVPKGVEAFAAYAIASARELIPEMENAARLSLVHPITFESIAEGLQLFEGCALLNLVDYRKRCRDKFVRCLEKLQIAACTSCWVGCSEVMPLRYPLQKGALPRWLGEVFSRNRDDLMLQKVTSPLDIHSRIYEECNTAFQKHVTCNVCLLTHLAGGPEFYGAIRASFVRARDKEFVGPFKCAGI